uniref:Uncharacterized protein n=1 Tax=Acrobeloides nanus TaxID=290746 RepID=A0A914CT82_9BILA
MSRSSLLILIFACLFIEIGYATKNSFCRDQTLECMEEEHLHNYVKGLQDKVQELRSHLTESNCTICNVIDQPCLNGGTCSPTNDYNWT